MPAPGTNTTNTYGKKSHVLPFWRGDRFHQPNGRGGVAQEAPLERARRQDRPRAHVTYDDLRDLIITDYTNNGRKSLGDLKTTRLPRLDAVFGGTNAARTSRSIEMCAVMDFLHMIRLDSVGLTGEATDRTLVEISPGTTMDPTSGSGSCASRVVAWDVAPIVGIVAPGQTLEGPTAPDQRNQFASMSYLTYTDGRI